VVVGPWDITEPVERAGLHRLSDGANGADGDGHREARANVAGAYDSVVCLNVLEHVEDDRLAVRNMRDALAPDGRLILLVPAHPGLFCALDEDVGHYRRYSQDQLRQVLDDAGMQVERLFPFNFWGLFGWWLNGVVLRRRRLPGEQLSLFGRLSPLLILAERLLRPPVGLSFIAVARLKAPTHAPAQGTAESVRA
jgi:SAM-dependent methyltransferase